MKLTLLYIAIFVTISLNGQVSLHSDTIRISEVIISGKRAAQSSPGYKKEYIDSFVIADYSHKTIAEILSLKSGIYIKSYGMGGTATPAFRGTGAGHTQVTWNGINIIHPMLGQSDLSLIPSGMIDNIQICYGGASMNISSGGIGGIINLESKPDWLDGTSATISPGIGSFGQYSGLVSLKSGNTRFQSKTKAFYYTADNDFRFLNTERSAIPVWETRTNNQVKQAGLMQELYYRWQSNVLSAGIWYQSADRNLPSSMLIQQQGTPEIQSDESLRAIIGLEQNKATSDFFLTGAWIMNRLNYLNIPASIDSRNVSNSITIKTGAEKRILVNSKLKVTISEELNKVNSNNYNGQVFRNTASLSVLFESIISERIGSSILVREILDADRFLIPDFSTGVQYRLFNNEKDLLKANISRNSRIPTLNDLYWIPGGNPDLKNEYAYICELNYEMDRDISSSLNLKYNITLFRNSIKDMVQWSPGAYTYWTADNIQSVRTMGIESSISVKFRLNKLTSVIDASYSYTKAYDTDYDEEKSQLMYIPDNLANASCRLVYKDIYASWNSDFTGLRYITADNSKYLPSYLINSISSGYKVKIKDSLLDLNVNVNNLFDINYQSIAHFPLPGRTYSIKLSVQLNK